jgi:hypothetical protein
MIFLVVNPLRVLTKWFGAAKTVLRTTVLELLWYHEHLQDLVYSPRNFVNVLRSEDVDSDPCFRKNCFYPGLLLKMTFGNINLF